MTDLFAKSRNTILNADSQTLGESVGVSDSSYLADNAAGNFIYTNDSGAKIILAVKLVTPVLLKARTGNYTLYAEEISG